MTTADGRVVSTSRVIFHGPPSQRWNMVIMGDGYRAAELPKFRTDVEAFVVYLHATVPFNQLWNAINIWQVEVISTDTGADDPLGCPDGSGGTGYTAATYFDSTFCSSGGPRRLLYGNASTALLVARAQVPEVHAALVMVNSPQYGGGGGSVAWFSANLQSAEIALHELGHSFFGLADEYGDQIDTYVGGEPSAPNVTANVNRATTKWHALIQPGTPVPTQSNPNCTTDNNAPSPTQIGTVGLFEGGGRARCGLFRPEHVCRMRILDQPFCAVCQERIRRMLAPFGGTMAWELIGNSGTNPATDALGTLDNQPLVIKTNGAERIRIAGNGNVGIGPTSTPSSLLHVKSPASGKAAIGVFTLDVQSFGSALNAQNSYFMRVSDIGAAPPNGLTVFYIRGDGNVGIGTTAPRTKLEVTGGTISSGVVIGGDTPAINYSYEYETVGVTNLGFNLRLQSPSSIVFHTGGNPPSEKLIIRGDGNVGIGTTAPRTKLEVAGGTISSGVVIGGDTPAINYSYEYETVGVTNPGLNLRLQSPSSIIFHTGGNPPSEKLTITPAGRIGAGTPNPNAQLHVVAAQNIEAVRAENSGSSPAVIASNSGNGAGLMAQTQNGIVGIAGLNLGDEAGVVGWARNDSLTSFAVYGTVGPVLNQISANFRSGAGVVGYNPNGVAVIGLAEGTRADTAGVEGIYEGTTTGAGVFAVTTNTSGAALRAQANVVGGVAGEFVGDVKIQGTITSTGKGFRIDHPLDPANKFLNHSSVESPDMMNIYNGNIITDENSEAVVVLPDYFIALNHDFKYQLTVLGDFAQAIIKSEIEGIRFVIGTDRPGVKVSWQVTGIRRDLYAQANRIPVEEDKLETQRGRYLHPELIDNSSRDNEVLRPLGWLASYFARPTRRELEINSVTG